MGAKSTKTFSNWSENISTDLKITYCKSDQDIIRLIRKAAKAHDIIRVVGAGHSISPTVTSPRDRRIRLISLAKYSLVPDDILIDHEQMTVTVNAGWSLSKFYHELNKYRYFLETQPASAAFNIAGLVCTPVHGAKLGASHLSDSLLEMRLIDGNGEVVLKNRSDPDFDYYSLSLGIFGVITSLTFKLYKRENFKLEIETHPFPTNIAQLVPDLKVNQFFESCIRKCLSSDSASAAEYAQCFLDLHGLKILCLHWTETNTEGHIREYTEPESVGKISLLESFLKTVDSGYRQSPMTLRLIGKLARHTIIQNVEYDYNSNRDLFWLSTAIRAYFMEYYIPIHSEQVQVQESLVDSSYYRDADRSSGGSGDENLDDPSISLEKLYAAVNVVMKAVKRAKKANKEFIPDLPCEFRFVVSSHCHLSPIYYDPDEEVKTVYLGIEIPCLAGGLGMSHHKKSTGQLNSDFLEFYAQVEAGWRALGGRPHWGKLFGVSSDLFDCQSLLGHKTQVLLNNLTTPIFLNEFAKGLLGMSPE